MVGPVDPEFEFSAAAVVPPSIRSRRHEEDVTALIAEREGWDPDDLRAYALAATVGTLVRVAFEETSRRCGAAPLVQVFRETVEAFVAATQDTAHDTGPPDTIER